MIKAYAKLQQAFVKEYNLKVGDKLTVSRETPSYLLGWDTEWNSEMTTFIGETGKITDISEKYGFALVFENGEDWFFPVYAVTIPQETVVRSFTLDSGIKVEITSLQKVVLPGVTLSKEDFAKIGAHLNECG